MPKHVHPAVQTRQTIIGMARNYAIAFVLGIPLVFLIFIGIAFSKTPAIGTVYTIHTEAYKPLMPNSKGCRMAVGANLTVKWFLPYHTPQSTDFPREKNIRHQANQWPLPNTFSSSVVVYTDPGRNAKTNPNGGFCPDGETVIYLNQGLVSPAWNDIPRLSLQD